MELAIIIEPITAIKNPKESFSLKTFSLRTFSLIFPPNLYPTPYTVVI